MATLPELSRKEWEAMMANVLSDVSIDPTEKWGSVDSPGNKGNDKGGAKVSTEIPDNHPEDGGPVLPTDPQKHDTDDKPGVVDEIPAGGGFVTKPAKTPETGPISKEIPSAGPAQSGPVLPTAPDKGPAEKWANKVGRPQSTGKPSGTFARLSDVKYDGDGWANRGAMGNDIGKKVDHWSDVPAGVNDGSGSNKTPDKWGKPDANAGRSAGRFKTDPEPSGNMKADEDLDKDLPDNLALPDGSFFTQNVDDLKNNIDKVKNADQTNPRTATHPWYTDIKRHLMTRAQDLGATHLIPGDWSLSMAALWDHDYSDDQRRDMAKKGHALSDGSYPIGNLTDLHNAAILAQSGHGNADAAKALIRKRAKDLGVKSPV